MVKDKAELTRREVLKAMNSVSQDLSITIELCDDFEDRKVPTLSFSIFFGEKGDEHTYFEKPIKNQVYLWKDHC